MSKFGERGVRSKGQARPVNVTLLTLNIAASQKLSKTGLHQNTLSILKILTLERTKLICYCFVISNEVFQNARG